MHVQASLAEMVLLQGRRPAARWTSRPASRCLLLLQELKWSLSPQTPVSWLNVYMQVAYLKETDELLLPRYPQATFTQIAQVRLPPGRRP